MINKNNITDSAKDDVVITENDNNKAGHEAVTIAEQEKELAYKHQRIFALAYETIESEFQQLRKMQLTQDDTPEWQEKWNRKIGAKETGASAAIKLIRALDKITTLEKKALAVIDSKNESCISENKTTGNQAPNLNIVKLRLQQNEEKNQEAKIFDKPCGTSNDLELKEKLNFINQGSSLLSSTALTSVSDSNRNALVNYASGNLG
jgi:hypothetical protein